MSFWIPLHTPRVRCALTRRDTRLGRGVQLPELPARGLQDGADRERTPGELRRALPRAARRGVLPPGDRRRPAGPTRAPPRGRRHRAGRQGRDPGRSPDRLHPSAPCARRADPVLGGARVRRPAAALIRVEAVALDRWGRSSRGALSALGVASSAPLPASVPTRSCSRSPSAGWPCSARERRVWSWHAASYRLPVVEGWRGQEEVRRAMDLLSKFSDMAIDRLAWSAARSAVDAVRYQPAHTKLLMACGASQADGPQRWVGGVAALLARPPVARWLDLPHRGVRAVAGIAARWFGPTASAHVRIAAGATAATASRLIAYAPASLLV